MRNKSNLFLLFTFIYAISVFAYIASNTSAKVKADTNHIVISQIQLSGTSANDEFVELYNPTSIAVDLGKWRLTRKSSTGGSVQNLVASLSGTIQPKSYFLIAHPSATNSSIADITYSSSASAMTTNNTVTLFSDAGITTVDKVGLGTAVDVESTAFVDNPEGGESIVRKATENSTAISLFTGGLEALMGNGQDTDNNSTDFVLFTTPLPRNTSSPAAQSPTTQPTTVATITQIPSVTQTPTNMPTVTPTTIPTSTPSVMPTITPTAIPTIQPTATPTLLPSPTPTKTPTPTSTPIPTLIPTATQAPTSTPTPTVLPTSQPTTVPTAMPTPTAIPTPTPSGQIIVRPITPKMQLVCIKRHKQLSVLGFTFFIPQIKCSIERI